MVSLKRKVTTEERLEGLIKRGVKVLDSVPAGWKEIPRAATAPNGYVWIFNGKSMFSGEYEAALIKENRI